MRKGVLLGTCFGIIVLFVDYFGDGELIGWAIAGDHVRKRIAVVMIMCYFVALPFTLFFAMFSLFSALWYGGLDALRHYLLRLLAVWLGYMPRRCAHFLEYCSKLVFLRRVGGGYIFIHRMLLEHLAAMWEGEDKERGQGASIRSSSAIAAPT
jgi:hypothetical protein